MSLINKMLQDLDRRNAIGAAGSPVPPQQVRAVSRPGSGHEWFWRTLAVLTLIAIGWVGWVAYQLQPHLVATDLALSTGEVLRKKAAALAAQKPAAPAPKPVAAAPAPAAPAAPVAAAPAPAPAPAVAGAAQPPELFKLALAIDRPIPERAARPVAAAAKPAAAPARLVPEKSAIRVSKNERPRPPEDEAELLFRRGVGLLNQARISEAQADFAAALARHPGHEASRQALIAIHIERRSLEDARRLLEEGLKLNPAQVNFAAVLARVLVEGGDYAGAAGVLDAASGAGARDAEYQLLHGAVLQRLARHAEAIEAFQRAAQIADQPGVAWVALGISLEANGRKADALKAYRQSLAGPPLAQDVRTYAESRIRSLN